MRRSFWFDPLTQSLAGYSMEASAPVPFTGGSQPAQTGPVRLPAVTGRLGPKANLPLRELEFLRAHTQTPVKATLPSLTYASVLWVPGVSEKAYPKREECLEDALRLVRDLVSQLVASGVRYIQLDAPRYTHLVSEVGIANFRRVGIDPGTWLSDMIA